jgi:hypothetical protein
MNAIGPTTPPVAPAPAQANASQPPAGGEAHSLLIDPSPGALAGTDPLSMLFLFESKDQDLGLDQGTKRIEALQSERHQALAQEQQAIQNAVDAQHNRSFWDDLASICGEVAKVAAVVASVAAAIATAGAASGLTVAVVVAVAGAGLSCAAFADGELHVLHALGVDDDTAHWVDFGMSMGGAVCSLGAGLLAGGSAATGSLGIVGRASAVVAGASEVGKGASMIQAGEAQAQGDQAAADQVAAQAQSDHAARRMQVVFGDAENSNQQSERIMRSIANTKTIQNETSLSAATAVRG